MTAARDDLTALLASDASPAAFSASRSVPTSDLQIEARGVGPIRLPVSQAQARQLCKVARPARYGHGEHTILDRGVRDTWEVPKSRVKIDARRWNNTLRPALDRLGRDLGLPAGSKLRAELHSMLVYARGQFFVQHQDSEKDDTMIASLVVGLPAWNRDTARSGQRSSWRCGRARCCGTTWSPTRTPVHGWRHCRAFALRCGPPATPGASASRRLVEAAWRWAAHAIDRDLQMSSPTSASRRCASLERPPAAILQGAALVDASDVRDGAVERLCRDDSLLGCATGVLRATPRSQWAAVGVDAVAARCRAILA
ncbi:MAG: hypothetical protein M3417_01155, partial [Actinomycetota bacterium]|nr:hypothetical protein [Actinomycetota bacterium]